MKKLPVFLALFLVFGARQAFAASTVYWTQGILSLPIPWENINAVYLYNETAHVSQVGGEAVLAQVKIGSYKNSPIDLNFTAGAVIDANSSNIGTAFVGTDLWLPNPAAPFTTLSSIQPGIFGGYSINSHEWQWGLKAAFNIFPSGS